TDGLVEVPGRDIDDGTDRLLGEADRLVTTGFRAGAADLVRALSAGTGTNDDRALALIWRSRPGEANGGVQRHGGAYMVPGEERGEVRRSGVRSCPAGREQCHAARVGGCPPTAPTAGAAARGWVPHSQTRPAKPAAATARPPRPKATEYTCPAGPVSVAISA